ncbi:MAG: helix-turn-helix transcriptional regulator [Dehalococcoidales bacterium]|nr:helix-turn-helix transcriptional regulator [Dehalococcoidales bacterium]
MRAEVARAIAEITVAVDADETVICSERFNGNIVEYAKKVDEILAKNHIRLKDRSALTPREREVLEMVTAGKSNQEMADKLEISKRTVEVHRANIYEKLGIKNQSEQLTQYLGDNRQDSQLCVDLNSVWFRHRKGAGVNF